MKTENRIKITRNGPYRVTVAIPLNKASIGIDAGGDSDKWLPGHQYDTGGADYHLCRCGHSQGKPFCDGSHAAVGFVGRETTNRPAYLDDAELFRGPEMTNPCAWARVFAIGRHGLENGFQGRQPGNQKHGH